jgi:hypothetical protein
MMACEFLPAAAVLDRRIWRTPAGEVAFVWAVFGLCDVRGVLVLYHLIPRSPPNMAIVAIVNAALMAPAILGFADAPLARRRWWWAAGLTLLTVLPMPWLGMDRTYGVAMRPLQGVFLLALGGMTLAAVVRRARGRLRDSGEFWICAALVVYLLLGAVWKPLLEITYARSHELAHGLELGRLTVETAIGVAIAWGTTLQRRGLALRGPAEGPSSTSPRLDAKTLTGET